MAKCLAGCTCRRHAIGRCDPGCECGKHSLKNSGQFKVGHGRPSKKCEAACECGRHVDKSSFRHTGEAKARIAKASRERERQPFSLASRSRISIATKAAMNRPDVRARVRRGLAVALADPAYRERRSQLTARLYAEGRIGRFRGPSKPQLALERLLRDAGYRTALEVPFDRAVVDIYLPEVHVGVEADGVYWHAVVERQRPGYYRRRDRFLASRFDLPTVRFTDAEIPTLTVSRLKEVIGRVQTGRHG